MLSQVSDMHRLSPSERADLIYGAARQVGNDQLWRAVLGERDAPEGTAAPSPGMDLATLVATLLERPVDSTAVAKTVTSAIAAQVGTADAGPLRLGPNAAHAPALAAAATRTGIPPAALAAIVDAEAARLPDGSWNTTSRNPRSSAAGLGQFLSGTWIGEAERKGTWLNGVAQARGWIGSNGRVSATAKSPLLALRDEPTASIQATADYARQNLHCLARAGIRIGSDAGPVARAAYLGHHLGTGDAIRFLRDGLASERAGRLLSAQVGARAAAERIAVAGEAGAAHRQWLMAYVERRIQPSRFTVV